MTTASPVTARSCANCPSFLPQEKQGAALGSHIGGPVCGLKTKAIGRPNLPLLQIQKAQEVTAKKCDEFGKPHPGYDDRPGDKAIKFQVAMPEISVGDPNQPERVTSCISCDNFVPATAVMTLSGWMAGYCKASGDLLMQDRFSKYAAGCPDRSYTTTPLNPYDTQSLSGVRLMFLPEYQEGFGTVDPLIAARKMSAIDPIDYPTDKPVLPAHDREGVRAWRKIVDPNGYGPDIFLPIFHLDRFSALDQKMVPRTGDDSHPEDYIDHAGLVYKMAALWIELEETPALWGEAGTGKTELFRHLAWMVVSPFTRINITSSSEIDDLAGRTAYTPERGTFFQYGRVSKGWTRTNVMLIDEPNTGPQEVWEFLRPLMDGTKQLVLDMNEGNILDLHRFCYFGVAMNPAWDTRNVGTNTLSDADSRRLAHIRVNLPPENVERQIIKKVLMHDEWEPAKADATIDLMMKCAKELRTMSADSVIPISWNIGLQLKVARAMKFFAPMEAFKLGAADALEQNHEQTILDIVTSHVV